MCTKCRPSGARTLDLKQAVPSREVVVVASSLTPQARLFAACYLRDRRAASRNSLTRRHGLVCGSQTGQAHPGLTIALDEPGCLSCGRQRSVEYDLVLGIGVSETV